MQQGPARIASGEIGGNDQAVANYWRKIMNFYYIIGLQNRMTWF